MNTDISQPPALRIDGALDAGELQRDIERTAASQDLQEGRAAWAGKQPPRFEGR